MEAATATRLRAPAGGGNGAGPPAIRLPRTLQTARFLVRPVAFFERYRRELGPTFAARLIGPGDVVFISDADSVKRLFGADRVNTIAPGRNIVLRPLLGAQSLLLQEGDEHLRRRKLMLPPFHGERMRAYEAAIAEVTEAEIAEWTPDSAFPVHPSMQAITLEVILRAVFGVTDPARRDALTGCLVGILAESGSPAAVGLVVPGMRRLPHYRAFARLLERTDELLAAEIAERRADQGLEERDDILSMLVAARFDDGSQMTDAELRDQLMTLLLAGHETTATGLAWTFDLLLHRPDALERLVAELDTDDTAYLDAVIEESLRIRPVVPMTGRLLHEPATLGGYRLDAGTIILCAIYLAHMDPELYPEPHAFRPERFLDADPGTYSWIPFGGGTRRCIGAAFAQMEMRVVLRTILDRFELKAASPALEQPMRRNVTLSPRDGTRVVALAR